MKVKFIFGEAKVGGSETLILRIARQVKKRHLTAELYCSRICKETEQMLKNEGINVIEYGKIFKPDVLNMNQEDICLFFAADHFFICQNFIKKRKLNTKAFLYIVHPYTITKWFLKKSKFLIPLYKNIFENNIVNGNIFFMDEQTIDETFSFYNFEIPKSKANIFRLPIDVNEDCQKPITQDMALLSIARADFPFKGYLKGLIETFDIYCSQDRESSLTIISYGKGIDTLKKWIDHAANSDRIQLIENVSYNKIGEYYKKARFYVGMGTTILEASSFGIPSFVVGMYTYDCNTRGFFSENPKELAIEPHEGRNILKYIERAQKMNDDEYMCIFNAAKTVIKSMYSSEKIVNYLLNTKSEMVSVPFFINAQMCFRKFKCLLSCLKGN